MVDCDKGKLFVGGISFETTEETLKEYFSKYGDVQEALICKDRATGNARGFGFVLFSDPSLVDRALQDKHVILSRTVEVKKAIPRGGYPHKQHTNARDSSRGGNYSQYSTKKIFVGGLPASVTEEDFKVYFEKFGRITDVVVMYDSATHRPRGFGFITFESEASVEHVMQHPFHALNNKAVEVKRAVPKDGNGGNSNGFNGIGVGMYQGGIFPPFGPSYQGGLFTGYPPPPFSGYPYAAYPNWGYGGLNFGPAQYVSPRSPWNSAGMVGVRRSPSPYGNTPVYPGYMNGGVGGFVPITTGDHQGILSYTSDGKWNLNNSSDAQLAPGSSPVESDGGKLEEDSPLDIGSCEADAGKKNQSHHGPDGHSKPCTVTDSN